MRQVLGILLGVLLSASADAAYYSWGVKNITTSSGLVCTFLPDGRFSTPDAAIAYAQECAGNGRIVDNISKYNDTQWNFRSRHPSQSFGYIAAAYRGGDSCPPDTVYNSENGHCEADCSAMEGQVRAARGPDSVITTDGEGVRTIAEAPFDGACFDGCYYEIESSFSDRLSCAMVYGSTDTGFCNYSVHGTGESCSANTGVPAAGGDPINEPEGPDRDSPEYACDLVPGYVWTGTQCVPKPTDPGDGSDGGDGSGDGSGDGDGSGGGGGGGGSTGGDGGDGSGDGSDGGDGSTGGGGDGGEDPERKELKKPGEQGSFDEAIAEYDDKIEEALAEVKAQAGQFGTLLENKLNFTLPNGNAMLPCNSVQIMGQAISICLSSWIDELAILRNLILFVAAVISLYIIFREDK